MKLTDEKIIRALQEGKYIRRKSCITIENDYSINTAFLRDGGLIWNGEYADFIIPFNDIISDDWEVVGNEN